MKNPNYSISLSVFAKISEDALQSNKNLNRAVNDWYYLLYIISNIKKYQYTKNCDRDVSMKMWLLLSLVITINDYLKEKNKTKAIGFMYLCY